MKKVAKIIFVILLVFVVLIGLGLGYLTFTDYQPEAVETVELTNELETKLQKDKIIKVYTWNIGYAGLGAEEDFFMDDGESGLPESKEVVEAYLNGIIETVETFDADFIFFQEVDLEAKRSYGVNEKSMLDKTLLKYSSSYAMNYNVKYVPVPLPPMGKVVSGIASYANYKIDEVTRYALPGEFSWPQSVAMLDRCMLVSRVLVEGTEAELVLVNAHFSAYDDGGIREQQLAFIKDFIEEEYQKGNYVILGGDWNQTFPGVDTTFYPMYKDGTFWNPNQISSDWIGEGWTFGYGDGTPTYRLLNAPYEDGVTQVGVIDGFLVSPNVKLIKSEVVDVEFEYSDHNPVHIEVELLD